jgi:hypothetical protein
MKKLDQSISVEYPPLKLYRDDLEKIEDILKDSLHEVEIVVGELQFDSIDELAAHFSHGRIRSLKLGSKSPYTTIELAKMWSRLYVGSSEDVALARFHRLDEILRAARRSCWRLYNLFFVMILMPVGLGASPFIFKLSETAAIVIGATSVAWLVWVTYVHLRRHSTIWLSHRGAISFWARKKDDLVLTAVKVVAGAVLGAAGTLLVQWFGK